MIVTHDLDRLARFYRGLTGAQESSRIPEEWPTFNLGLRIGGSELGIVADASVGAGPPGRVLISLEVDDVDACPNWAAPPPARPTTCRGASGSRTSGTPTAMRST